MKNYQLKNMFRGWFVGDFEPSVLKTTDFEVGVKKYQKGDREGRHHHCLSKEITLILSGKVCMNNIEYEAGSIVVIDEMESTDFHALEDTVTVVVRNKSISTDKYMGAHSSEN